MGNFITSTAFITPTGTASSTTAGGFSATNVTYVTQPNRVWRGTGTTGAYVSVTFGSQTVAAAVFDNLNSASVTVTGAGSVAVSRDSADGRYKLYATIGGSRTEVRVTCDGATTDGLGFTVGSIVALTSVNTWTINAEFPYEITPLWPVIANDDFSGGGREPVLIGNKYCRISMTQSNFPTAVGATDVWAEINGIAALGQHQPLVFYRNSGDTSQVYVCRRIGDCTMSLNGPGHFGVRGLVLEECV